MTKSGSDEDYIIDNEDVNNNESDDKIDTEDIDGNRFNVGKIFNFFKSVQLVFRSVIGLRKSFKLVVYN